jgi:hypothetical protein
MQLGKSIGDVSLPSVSSDVDLYILDKHDRECPHNPDHGIRSDKFGSEISSEHGRFCMSKSAAGQPKPVWRGNIGELDGLRGISIFLVFLCH